MNEFTCSEHSVRIRWSKKRSTGNQPCLNFLTILDQIRDFQIRRKKLIDDGQAKLKHII